jgi:hypothetical protein
MRFVGNFRKEIEEYRKEAISIVSSEQIPTGYIRWLPSFQVPWKPDSPPLFRASYIAPYGADPYSRLWHIDGRAGRPTSFVVCGYPSPTQFLVAVRGELPKYDRAEPDSQGFNANIKALIKKGRAKIFTGEPGDAWEIPIDAIHRSNPKATENHFVLRATYM